MTGQRGGRERDKSRVRANVEGARRRDSAWRRMRMEGEGRWGRERGGERESRGSWTLCSGARVRSTLKGLWLAPVPAAPALSHHRVPFTYRYFYLLLLLHLLHRHYPLPLCHLFPYRCSSTTQLATLVATLRRAKLPYRRRPFYSPLALDSPNCNPSPWNSGQRAAVVRPQRRLPSPSRHTPG